MRNCPTPLPEADGPMKSPPFHWLRFIGSVSMRKPSRIPSSRKTFTNPKAIGRQPARHHKILLFGAPKRNIAMTHTGCKVQHKSYTAPQHAKRKCRRTHQHPEPPTAQHAKCFRPRILRSDTNVIGRIREENTSRKATDVLYALCPHPVRCLIKNKCRPF